jgi:hypothetical protein
MSPLHEQPVGGCVAFAVNRKCLAETNKSRRGGTTDDVLAMHWCLPINDRPQFISCRAGPARIGLPASDTHHQKNSGQIRPTEATAPLRWQPITSVWPTATKPASKTKRQTGVCTLGTLVSADRGRVRQLPRWRGPAFMHPTARKNCRHASQSN